MKPNHKVYIILFIFLSIQLCFIAYHQDNIISDDFNYLYMGKLITDGNIPYKDFFVAHPPLQLLLYGILLSVFGLKTWLVHIIPLISIMISGYLVYKITNRWYYSLIFLAMFPIFHTSTIGFGLNLGLMFLLLSIYTKNPIHSGIFAGLSVFTRLHFIISASVGIFQRNSIGDKTKYAIGSFFLAIPFLLMLIFVENSMNSLIFYHSFKSWNYFVTIRWFILGFGLISTIVSYRTKYFTYSWSYFAFLMFLKTVFAYYMIPMAAFFVLALSEKDLNLKRYQIVLSILLGLSLGATMLTVIDVSENKAEIEEIIEFIPNNAIVCGNNEITPLIALKTHSIIKDNQVDTNFQRKKELNCNNSFVIYRFREFLDCEVLKEKKKYKIGSCHRIPK